MSDKNWLYDHSDYSNQHLNDLHREAAQDRLANELPEKPGLVEAVLRRIATVIQTL